MNSFSFEKISDIFEVTRFRYMPSGLQFKKNIPFWCDSIFNFDGNISTKRLRFFPEAKI
jgi:hypothetical protein